MALYEEAVHAYHTEQRVEEVAIAALDERCAEITRIAAGNTELCDRISSLQTTLAKDSARHAAATALDDEETAALERRISDRKAELAKRRADNKAIGEELDKAAEKVIPYSTRGNYLTSGGLWLDIARLRENFFGVPLSERARTYIKG